MIAEAYFFDKKVPLHLDYATLAEKLPRIRPKRLVLTHINDDMLSRSDEAPCENAHDGLVITLRGAEHPSYERASPACCRTGGMSTDRSTNRRRGEEHEPTPGGTRAVHDGILGRLRAALRMSTCISTRTATLLDTQAFVRFVMEGFGTPEPIAASEHLFVAEVYN